MHCKDFLLNFRASHLYALLVLVSLFLISPVYGIIKPSSPFVVFTPPKTGTHLVGKCLELMTGRKAAYFLTNLGNNDEEVIALVDNVTVNEGFVVAHNFNPTQLRILVNKGYKIIFTLRDPRDQLVSMFDWFREGQWNWISASKIVDPDEQITEMITGEKFTWRALDHCILRRLAMLNDLPRENYQFVRFESLVGAEGQGNDALQLEEILQTARAINLNLSRWAARAVAKQLFGNSPTFRFGQIGRWKNYLKPYHIELYKQHYGSDSDKYGVLKLVISILLEGKKRERYILSLTGSSPLCKFLLVE